MGKKTVHVVIDNPERVASGVGAMTLDNQVLGSHVTCVDPDEAGVHEVRVRLGAGGRARASSDPPRGVVEHNPKRVISAREQRLLTEPKP